MYKEIKIISGKKESFSFPRKIFLVRKFISANRGLVGDASPQGRESLGT